MSEYELLLAPDVAAFVEEQSGRIAYKLEDRINRLSEDPYPPEELGERRELPFGGQNWYWRKVRTIWAIFYVVDEAAKEVRIAEVQKYSDAEQAYGL